MTDSHSLSELVEIAKRAARTAGEAVLAIYDSGDYKAYDKADDSPVTTADYRANEIIMDILQQETPDIPIMSEETDNGDLASRQHWTRYWLIDPIDGTQEFIARSGDFAVNIALIENNQPVIGVIYWPPGETLYSAVLGQGAFKECPMEQRQIHVRDFDDPNEDVVMLAISRRQSRDKVMSRMNEDRIYQSVPLGSCSLKSCFIAEGKADLFLRIGVTGEWDTGAAQCIVNEAGGKIFSAEFDPLTYNQRDILTNPDFVVTGDQRVNWQGIVNYHKGKST
ncbi:3'(2'),5'-bisphosphate nucleotidase CysQ [Aestuariibacter halophilus]|uniref:3'(2'),5'-bisphosphate nucleotidase CysQ n=1 Tax=Fluctibacter halophilus TaxID=226011 RepID=A0ABS8GB51_9ALTE|nr:3'(2'),5'-bisphosphate nucleotidase CysQ [Aestuariibacter halophilus]MCC2617040.1 3'(2'),5'-bisphosphate nucleotidase CysQ [Aestuariibacter halophilus]